MGVLHFANPSAQFQRQRADIEAAIKAVLERGVYIQGREHDAFEANFSAYLGARHAIGVGNGTDALVLALMASGIGQGDRVAVPSHTAPATISAVRRIGAIPVFVDVDPSTYTMPLDRVEAVIGTVKAVILVHLYGYPADARAFRELADKHGVVLIEDCAQSAGASSDGERLGAIGHAGCFSFFPTKNLGAIGDGGAVVTNDDETAVKLRQLRTYGWDSERVCLVDGMNSRLDEIQAAILNVKLPSLDRDNERRRQIAARYVEGLSGLSLQLPVEASSGQHVYHLFVVALDERDRLRSHLLKDGVAAGIHYALPSHLHPAFRSFATTALPVTENLVQRILTLPIYPELSEDEVAAVISSIRSFFSNA